MERGGDGNKYLHKKFKKQTIFEAPEDDPCYPPLPGMLTGARERFPSPEHLLRYSTKCDRSSLKSSITYPTNYVVRRDRLFHSSYADEHDDDDISDKPEYVTVSYQQEGKTDETLLGTIVKGEPVAARVYDAHNASTSTAANGGKYVCPFCSLACSKPSVLQKHIRAHTNERPYPCQSCNFSFKTRSNLYKHCRSRTHVNRVMGNKGSGGGGGAGSESESNATTPPPCQPPVERPTVITDTPPNAEEAPKAKPYKPRFHTKSYYENENEENSMAIINEKITTEPTPNLCYTFNKILDSCEQRMPSAEQQIHSHSPLDSSPDSCKSNGDDQPLNLTSKNRKRCLSEVSFEPAKKSLIKELLLKNLSADTNLQCQHCKMIFRTFTELELHKMKMCKGRGGPRYSRSSSVNVATILTQNKDSFNFSHKSPGPCLGKTRLVESDKNKSFSCDDGFQGSIKDIGKESYHSSVHFFSDKLRKPPVKLFGGEVKVTQTPAVGDHEDVPTYPQGERPEKPDYHMVSSPKVSENRVIRNTLQSGGIVLHTMPTKQSTPMSGDKVEGISANGSNGDYSNIMDFSQNAAKLLAPSLKQLNLTIPGVNANRSYSESPPQSLLAVNQTKGNVPKVISVGDTTDPMSLLVNGKVVRYVPGMPGPIIAEAIKSKPVIRITPSNDDGERVAYVKSEAPSSPGVKMETLEPPPVTTEAPRKFARPNSLALKPSSVSLKHHHGLTPTMFNQILISPDTPRGDKKYNEQLMNGNYYSNLGLKSSTKPVYCTLNKTQPFYVPHFRKLSMYSEWRQQDNKGDKWYLLEYDSRQRNASYSIAGKYRADKVVDSRYKFIPGDVTNKKEETIKAAAKSLLGGYESHEDYNYVRGRDEASTRNQEHEAAYGLLSLSQKVNSTAKELPSPSMIETINRSFVNAEQLVHVFKMNYVKNKILDQNISLSAIKRAADAGPKEMDVLPLHARETRPLTYPYTTPITASEEPARSTSSESVSSDQSTERNIIHFNVIKRYNPPPKQPPPVPVITKSAEHVYLAPKQISPVPDQRRHVVHMSLPPPPPPSETSPFSASDDSEAMDLSFSQVAANERVPDDLRINGAKQLDRGSTSTGPLVGKLQLREYDNSAMETLADIATKQEKLEKNSVAKNVATEFLKLATKNEHIKTEEKSTSVVVKSDLIVKSEENKNCMICNKTFNKPSQLRLHMNIHYLERPYRCDSCSVSFRTKGHLQKHERSAGHHNKLSSSPAQSSQEPRPFKCIDCSIAFRIHGHLAKHLRSKMHILKLECLSKVPFGLYAELERSNSLLTEINTADGDQCLDSLKALARRIFINEPGKLTQLNDDHQCSEATAS